MTTRKAKKPAPKPKPKKRPAPRPPEPDLQAAAQVAGTERATKAARTAELIRREQEAKATAERAAAAVVARYEDDNALVAACGKLLDVFAAACLKIRTKQGGPLWPFVLNWIQIDYLRTLRDLFTGGQGDFFRGVRDLIVKPRQLGFSTFIAALFFMDGLLEPGRVSVIVTHDEKISKELLVTYRLFYDELPEDLKRGTRLKQAAADTYEIAFDGIPETSKFTIRTEKGTEWRGGVIHNLHASEAAFYKGWAKFFASYVQAVPASGNIIFETTCNGRNEFYEEVMLAIEGGSPYRVVFYEWFRHPEYRLPWDPMMQAPVTKEEQALIDQHGLDLEQIAWRRWKMSEVKDKFPQEYPETLLGAFLATGRPFFDLASVDRGHERAKAFWREVEEGKRPRPREPRAGVITYEDPIPGDLYMLSADIAEGMDKGTGDGEKGGHDFHAAYVIHAPSLRVVASFHRRDMPAIEYAEVLNRLGRLYQAVLAPERNNHGHTVVSALKKVEYPELYHHLEYNEAGQKFLKAGWPTSVTTRPMMLDALDTAIRRDAFICYDLGFWREADRFVRNEKTGKPEAMSSWHDDRIMGAAIGVYLCTLGRTAWGLEGNEGRDASGFPRAPGTYGPPIVGTPVPTPKETRPAAKAVPPPAAPSPLEAMRAAHAEAAPPPAPEVHLKDVVAKATPFAGLPQSLTPSGAAGGVVVEAIQDRNERRKKTCGQCTSCGPLGSGHWCSTLHMRIIDTDPACDRFTLPEVEGDEDILDSDFGGESWT